MSLSIGVIGTGKIVERGHLPGFAEDERCKVTAIAGRNTSRLDELGRDFDIQKTYPDWRAMIEEEELDAVSIATPPFLHAEMSIAAMQAGIDVLVEKPVTSSIEELEAMVACAEEHGRIGMVEQTLRYNPVFEAAHKLIQEGAIGEITRIHGALLNRGPRSWAPDSTWFFDTKLSGGGLLLDSGVHVVDLIRHFTGANFSELRGDLVYMDEEGIEEEAILIGELASGIQASVNLSWHVDPAQSILSVFGSQGHMQINVQAPDPIILYQGDIVTRPSVEASSIYGSCYRHFIDCCLDRAEPSSSLQDNLNTLKPLLAIYDREDTIRRHR